MLTSAAVAANCDPHADEIIQRDADWSRRGYRRKQNDRRDQSCRHEFNDNSIACCNLYRRSWIYSRLTAAVSLKEAAVIRRIALASCILIVISGDTWAEPSPTPNHITSRIPRQSVQSTAIAKVGYSKRRHILEIEFVNGAVYRYFDVPVSVYRELMSAESKARFYDSNIKKHYRSALVRQRQKAEPPGNSDIRG